MKKTVAFLYIFGLLSIVSASVQADTYSVNDLGTLPDGTWSRAFGINSSGKVVGRAGTTSDPTSELRHAFLYRGGEMQDLGTLGGMGYYDKSEAFGINDNEQVVGWAYIASGSYGYYHAFLYSGGAMQDLGTLGGGQSQAFGINDRGHVVGYSYNASGDFHAFLYSDGTMQDLGTLGEDSQAYSINTNGQVVGWSDTGSGLGSWHAFLYSGGTMQDLGTLGGAESRAFGINNIGQVAGWSNTSTGKHAFLYSDGSMQDLGTLGGTWSEAWDINDNGQIVGWSWTAPYESHAFLYSDDTMTDLNNLISPGSGWILREATAINDSGQIVGYGSIGGHNHAFLLTPIPEPSTMTLFTTCIFSLICFIWRRRGMHIKLLCGAVILILLTTQVSQADVFNMPSGQTSLEMVTVGNPGNEGEQSRLADYGDTAYYGGVPYSYQIGKYEVTNAQWQEFLNTKASVGDPYGLYNTDMAGFFGGITRSGSGTPTDPYVYSVKDGDANWDNRPVNYVSFWDAARFANWLHNGQGNGDTESGAYINIGNQDTFARQSGALYFIPTENEWYKAAYYDPNKLGGPGYWDYQTGTDTVPNNGNPEGDTGNTANFYDGNYTVGSPYHTTPVGYFGESESPYGTFDQGGNMMEFNETTIGAAHILRGGYWDVYSYYLLASRRYDSYNPPDEFKYTGFRVAMIPEPCSITLIMCGAIVLLNWWRCRK